jgi:hypothetical protein
LKTASRIVRNEGQNPELAEFTAFFPWLAAITGEMAGFSTTCWEYYSDGVGKTLNISGLLQNSPLTTIVILSEAKNLIFSEG